MIVPLTSLAGFQFHALELKPESIVNDLGNKIVSSLLSVVAGAHPGNSTLNTMETNSGIFASCRFPDYRHAD